MKKIWIIAHFSSDFEIKGNNRFNYLAEILAKNGYSIDFFTSDFSHRRKRKRNLITPHPNYNVIHIGEPGYNKNVSLKRFYSHYIFGRNLKEKLTVSDKPDVIYLAVPSLDAGMVTAKFCNKNNIPLIIDIQDLWPEVFKLVFHIPVLSDILFYPFSKMANYIYRSADNIVAVSETYLKRGLSVNKKDKDGMVVFLGTDLTTFDKQVREKSIKKPENEIWIVYIGTLGHSYNINIVSKAISILEEKGYENIVFKVVGDGPLRNDFIQYATNKGINCDFVGHVDYNKMIGYLSASDIAVNPISKGAAQSIINKHADYAAAGLPVVSTQECQEYRELIEKYYCGFNCECENTNQVADAIEKLIIDNELRVRMGNNHRKLAEEKFNRKHTYNELIDLIKGYTEV